MTSDDRELKAIAADILDQGAVDWNRVSAKTRLEEAAMIDGLRILEDLTHGFRHLQESAVRTPRVAAQGLFRFAGLEVRERVGSGSSGEVYRAYDPVLDQDVALKLRRPDSDALSHQFFAEARRLVRLRHLNVVSVFGAGSEGGRTGLWMEMVGGETLESRLQQGPLPLDEVLAIGADLCAALSAVHGVGLVHGDIKPENILQTTGGRYMLTDFGASHDIAKLRASRVVSGTLNYLAPEVLRGDSTSASSDLYALAVLLFRLLSGRYPYPATGLSDLMQQQADGDRMALLPLRPDVPQGVAQAIEAALSNSPERRPANARAFAAALASGYTRGDRLRKVRSFAAAAMFAAVLCGAVYYGWMRSGGAGGAYSWQTSATFYRVDTSGRQPLHDGEAVALGEFLSLRFESDRPSYVYVFDADDAGHATVLFPLDGIVPVNPLTAAGPHELPGTLGRKALNWRIDSHATRENFVVVAATSPLPSLERAISDWQRASRDEIARRGTSSVVLAPDEADVRNASLQKVLDQVAEGVATGDIRRWQFVFPHVAQR